MQTHTLSDNEDNDFGIDKAIDPLRIKAFALDKYETVAEMITTVHSRTNDKFEYDATKNPEFSIYPGIIIPIAEAVMNQINKEL